MEDHILIRYGELSLKKTNRRQFVQKVTNSIKRALKDFEALEYESRGMRFYIHLHNTPSTDVIKVLQRIPGLYSFSVVERANSNIDDICVSAKSLVENELKEGKKTFKVETNRADKNFPMTSLEISKEVARYLFKNIPNLQADVHNPDFTLDLDVRVEGAFLFTKTYMGMGGLPAGSLGRATLMISGGIDSVVAGYLTIKKGVSIDAIHYASPPYTSDMALQKVIDLLEIIAPYTEYQSINLYVVPFTKLQSAIYEHVREDYGITIMRRMMYRIGERITNERGNLAIVNGENIGQVASQTLESMNTINSVVKIPVIRPLATFDKSEITDIAVKIGTYETSIKPYEDCCTVFVPKHPQIKPMIKIAEREEQKFDYESLIDEACTNVERIVIKANRHYDYINKKLSVDEKLAELI
ncbi:MAG: tRNA uracil 4-sulfurtransferase ThiI [Bacilli bacterium]|nr:tRNA 4-thiouridine(8) synthase ThiI [Mollicutes bacterium]MDY3899146.1 tRNA uracil 4-sulfurtransferase ThiI [Bacilli bacterium]